MKWRIQNQNDVLVELAFEKLVPVGFKMGQRRGRTKFVSWIGGVRSEFRRKGIGTQLMEAQFEWCKSQGYRSIQTQTLNRWKEMLILNLKNEFQVVGVFQDPSLGLKIVLERNLGA